jgi:hypothetical protein
MVFINIHVRWVYCGTAKGAVLTVKEGRGWTQNCAYTSYCTTYMKFIQKYTIRVLNGTLISANAF